MKMLITKRLFILFSVVTILFSSGTFNIYSADNVNVCVNGKYLDFDVPPTIESGRTLVPVRGVFESINAGVEWFPESQRVEISKDDSIISLKINSNIAYVNQESVKLDVPARIISGRTFVPIRFITESIGANVGWDDATRTVIINTDGETHKNEEFVFDGSVDGLMGVSLKEIKKSFGEPQRIDLSRYGFDWYIYNDDLERYIQIGIEKDKVVGVFTNSLYYKLNGNIGVGMDILKVEEEFGEPLAYILKGNTKYRTDNSGEQKMFNIKDEYFVTVFFDIFNESKVTSYLLLDCETERAFNGYYGEPSEELIISYEKEVFDLANTVRVRHGLAPFKWNDEVASVARAHSKDMILNDFFSHVNLLGESPFDRMKKAGISYMAAGENIAMGQLEAVYAHEAWMNSEGHRANILGDNTYLGVGVFIGDDKNIAYTQNFYTSRGR